MPNENVVTVKVPLPRDVQKHAAGLARKAGLRREKVYTMAIVYALGSTTFVGHIVNLGLLNYRPEHPNGLD